MKKLKYLLLVWSFMHIGFSIWQVYYAFAPKVGPIGNGPNETAIWTNFVFSMIGGIAMLGLAIILFKKDNKNQMNKEYK